MNKLVMSVLGTVVGVGVLATGHAFGATCSSVPTATPWARNARCSGANANRGVSRTLGDVDSAGRQLGAELFAGTRATTRGARADNRSQVTCRVSDDTINDGAEFTAPGACNQSVFHRLTVLF